VGFAQDPDGDRLAIVNEKGVPIGEDLTLALAVWQVLEKHDSGPVAVNLITSKAVEVVARQRGADVVRTRVGETHVSRTMLDIGAVVGGENNGGVIVPRIHPCRDSFAGMALVLELMASTGQSVSELRAAIPEFAVVRKKLKVRPEQAPGLLRRLRRHYAGQRLELSGWRFRGPGRCLGPRPSLQHGARDPHHRRGGLAGTGESVGRGRPGFSGSPGGGFRWPSHPRTCYITAPHETDRPDSG
jgi:phosphomannomutase